MSLLLKPDPLVATTDHYNNQHTKGDDMNKQQALKELTELRERADALEAIISTPESYGRERTHNSTYYVVLSDGEVEAKSDVGGSYSANCFKVGNYHLTREKAIVSRDRQLAYVRITDAIREQNKGWVPDWSDFTSLNYRFVYHMQRGVLDITGSSTTKGCPIELLGTKEAIEYVIKHHADDIKLYLGVE